MYLVSCNPDISHIDPKMTPIAQTKAYFKLSNERRLDEIPRLFHKKAIYSSDNTGLYFGLDAIMEMMHGFFTMNPEIHWQINNIKEVKASVVEVVFTATGVTAEAQPFMREGIERLVIENGLIRYIEVRAH